MSGPETTRLTAARAWELIHRERAATADLLEDLSPEERAVASLCPGWSVQVMAAHIVRGAEQTPGHFLARLTRNGFRFNTTMDREARSLAGTPMSELAARLRQRTTTKNRPPATVVTMLGEIVVHSEDIRRPLGRRGAPPPEAVAACLSLYARANFPTGTKRRIAGLRLLADDAGWTHGAGPEVRGPGLSLLMAVTGRGDAAELTGEGVETLRQRLAPTG